MKGALTPVAARVLYFMEGGGKQYQAHPVSLMDGPPLLNIINITCITSKNIVRTAEYAVEVCTVREKNI